MKLLLKHCFTYLSLPSKCPKPATDDLRDMENMRDATCVYGLFHIFYAASRDRFLILVSRASNRLAVEAVIMHETKGFSHAIRDKI